MNPDDIARILADEDTIAPSPRFLASVMRAVEREAAVPPPLAFPWMRALPAFLAVIAALVGLGTSLAGDPMAARQLEEQLARLPALLGALQLHWVALAVVATLVSLACGSGLVRGGHHA
jgi:hypothetical protein